MSEETIGESISELKNLLHARCPHLAPAVFPTEYCPKDLSDLCSTDKQREKVMKWAAKNGINSVGFDTRIEDEEGALVITEDPTNRGRISLAVDVSTREAWSTRFDQSLRQGQYT